MPSSRNWDRGLHRHPVEPEPLVPVDWGHATDRMLEAALMELDLEAARRRSRRVGRSTSMIEHRKELSATKRANRSTLNEIAASLGLSRSMMDRMLTFETRKRLSA